MHGIPGISFSVTPDAKEGHRGAEQRSVRIGCYVNDHYLLTSSDGGADAVRLVFFCRG